MGLRALVSLKRFNGLERPRYLSTRQGQAEDGDSGREGNRRKKGRLENIGLDRGHERNWSRIGGAQTPRDRRRVRVDASRCDASRYVEEASGAGAPPSRFQDRADDLEPSGAMGSGSIDGGALLSACAKAGLGQYRHRRPLAEPDAQRAQFADMVVQAS